MRVIWKIFLSLTLSGAYILVIKFFTLNLAPMILILLLSIYIAYNHPVPTIILVVFLGSFSENLKQISPIFDPFVETTTFNLRLWDPLLVGITITLFLKFLFNINLLRQFIRSYLFLTALFIVLTVKLFISISIFSINSINAIGEFRTYYSYLLLLPYLAIFARTPVKRLQMLKALMLVSFGFIIIALIKILLLETESISLGVRYVNSFGALAILYGLIAVFVARNKLLFNISLLSFVLLHIIGISIIVLTTHRSVWLASVTALAVLYSLGELKIKKLLKFIFVGFLSSVAVYFMLSYIVTNPLEFIKTRLLAFTNPEMDPTAYWRAYLWQEVLIQIQKNFWLGNPIGMHFQLADPSGNIVTVSPHSLYFMLLFHVGILGLFLYLAFIVNLLLKLIKAQNGLPILTDQVVSRVGVIILIAAHAYYIAYTTETDWITWSYLGLAGSATIANSRFAKLEK